MATRPILFAIDDDADVLRVIERDLRRHYAQTYRIMRANSGAVALDTLKQLRLRNEVVALFLVDQRMPSMSGTEFLAQAKQYFPDARCVLLTAYADTDAAIQAINVVRLDYYLLKPWEPPEQNLYPVLDDILDDWQGNFYPPFEGVRVLGHRWSPASYQVKDFLARNLIPYQWLDIETETSESSLLTLVPEEQRQLPLVFLADGTFLAAPTNHQLAEKTMPTTLHSHTQFYDLVIVGSGPAGLAGAVYGASEGLRTLLIERDAPGGQAGMSSRIENYLGFPSGLSGSDLSRRGMAQAKRLGAEFLHPQRVRNVRIEGQYRFIQLEDGSQITCHSLLVATGVSYRTLNIPGMDRLTGAGIYYGAALTEAISCRDEQVFIVGGANSAGQAAMHFSRYASNVTILVRGPSLAQSMSHYLIEQIHATPNITVCTCTSVIEVQGDDHLEALLLLHSDTNTQETVPASSLFIFIGARPCTDWLDGLVERDPQGYILTGPDLLRGGKRPQGWLVDRDPFLLEASVPGIFVAGDVRSGSVKRVASAVGDGSIAIQFVHRYLQEV